MFATFDLFVSLFGIFGQYFGDTESTRNNFEKKKDDSLRTLRHCHIMPF